MEGQRALEEGVEAGVVVQTILKLMSCHLCRLNLSAVSLLVAETALRQNRRALRAWGRFLTETCGRKQEPRPLPPSQTIRAEATLEGFDHQSRPGAKKKGRL